ncbi:MAG TPA: radical SAM family heme chaperone HemW [Allocoleopsis sp.]
MPSSIYIHIPFCRRRCFYCDFPVSVLGDRTQGDSSGTMRNYVDLLCEEINLTPVSETPIKTIFFGGGTPSLLSVQQLTKILTTLNHRFNITQNAEISIEMDPGTFDYAQIKEYKELGINRVSLGVQSFQNELLKNCGRSHNVDEIFQAIDLIRKAEINNFSIDLISGLPHQTLDQWEFSLKSAIDIYPHHISIYDLIVEEKTPFARYYEAGKTPLPTDEMTAKMYKLASEKLKKAGYEHYEISNYALPNYQCKHNKVYWQNQFYYGFGMGAASYINNMRFTRPRTTKKYEQWVKSGCIIDVLPSDENDILLESLMLGLRLAAGVKLTDYGEKFGQEIKEKIWQSLKPYYQQGWLENINNDPDMIRLSDPEGFLFSNSILSTLFKELQL